MSFDPVLAEIRFGCGLSPLHSPTHSVAEMMQRLAGPDQAAAAFPIPSFESLRPRMTEMSEVRRLRKSGSQSDKKKARRLTVALRNDFIDQRQRWLVHTLGRRASTEDGFRERLMAFWADHFTARASGVVIRRLVAPYWEEAIRPHITGSFRDLLISAVTHPMMLVFLNQSGAAGPNSRRAMKRGKAMGLNENLAREVLELHTLGVDGPYDQNDVRQLAELFTGMSFKPEKGFSYNRNLAEPGAETILGRSYGGDRGDLADIHAVLGDLAKHPATARHIAWKLAVHFVSDNPDPALVAAMATRFLDTDGNLTEVYQAMLDHPSAWNSVPSNVKPPLDFVSSALRALAVPPAKLTSLKSKLVRQILMRPLQHMGQDWDWPAGPDGWPEEDSHWITPQAMATRMDWALTAPTKIAGDLPDPREFVTAALGERAPEPVLFAARAAESRWEGVALVLVSPAFQRR